MKKSGLTRGFIWTLSIGIALIFVVAALGVVAYNGYTKASLEASYSTGKTETTIKIEKKNKLDSENVSTDIKQVNFNEDFMIKFGFTNGWSWNGSITNNNPNDRHGAYKITIPNVNDGIKLLIKEIPKD